jgi:hypothetical protein
MLRGSISDTPALQKSKGQHDPTPPKPKKLPSGPVTSVLDYHPKEVARQLTLMEFELFRKIRPTEIRSVGSISLSLSLSRSLSLLLSISPYPSF